MSATLGLFTYRTTNNLKSTLLLATFPLLLIGLIATHFWLSARDGLDYNGFVNVHYAKEYGHLTTSNAITVRDFTIERTLSTAPVVFSITIAWIIIGGWFSDGLIRFVARAKIVNRKENPLPYNLLENLCILRGMQMPRLYLIETSVINAFASGLYESSYAITITRGLIDKLEADELEAVLAHELSHIINCDSRLLVITALFSGLLLFIPETIWRVVGFTSSLFDNSGEDKEIGSLAPLVFFFYRRTAILILCLGYAISTFFRLALSRRREYLADAGAVELTKRPESLIHALEKISGNAELPYLPSGIQAMLIENPPGLFSLFDSHPTIEKRIKALRELGGLPDEDIVLPPKEPPPIPRLSDL